MIYIPQIHSQCGRHSYATDTDWKVMGIIILLIAIGVAFSILKKD